MIAKILVAAAAAIALSITPTATQPQAATVAPVTITGIDSHDGMIYEHGGQLYWAGSKYGCGFTWMDATKPWCGFGVWAAAALGGPWTFVRNLFDPAGTSAPAYFSETWQQICRGDGCFNPRMHRRADGVWVLWFNAPRDQRVHGGNQFWAMGCNGPTGPCGAAAGAPFGSTAKPPLWICNTGGDFSILDDAGTWYLFCGTSSHTISVERLQPWGTTGTGVGAQNLAGLSYVEGAGVFRSGTDYIITFGGNCPYCSATDTSYAVATSPLGPFVAPPGPALRRTISGGSCGGQPRTVVTLNGQAYEQVDHWYDAWNETDAATSLFPLVRTGALLQPANGLPWTGFAPFDCEVQP